MKSVTQLVKYLKHLDEIYLSIIIQFNLIHFNQMCALCSCLLMNVSFHIPWQTGHLSTNHCSESVRSFVNMAPGLEFSWIFIILDYIALTWSIFLAWFQFVQCCRQLPPCQTTTCHLLHHLETKGTSLLGAGVMNKPKLLLINEPKLHYDLSLWTIH